MMKTRRFGALALGIGVVGGPAFALESSVLCDDFASTTLDGNRWSAVERVRQVDASAMQSVRRDWGLTTSDAGSQSISWSEGVTRHGRITQLRASVRVTAVDLAGCAPNPAPTQARDRVLATFFNSGNRVPGSLVGDVLAQIIVNRASDSADAPGVLRVDASLFMCDSSDCNTGGTSLGSASLGTTSVGATRHVQVERDKANKQMLLSRDQGTPTATTYTADDSTSPGNAGHRRLGTLARLGCRGLHELGQLQRRG